MSLPLYLDEHVDVAILNGLRALGVDAISVQEDGLDGSTDLALFQRCIVLQRVIFSRDRDFLVEAQRRTRTNESFTGVVYVHQDRLSIGRCIEDLALLAQVFEPEDMANRIEYLPLK